MLSNLFIFRVNSDPFSFRDLFESCDVHQTTSPVRPPGGNSLPTGFLLFTVGGSFRGFSSMNIPFPTWRHSTCPSTSNSHHLVANRGFTFGFHGSCVNVSIVVLTFHLLSNTTVPRLHHVTFWVCTQQQPRSEPTFYACGAASDLGLLLLQQNGEHGIVPFSITPSYMTQGDRDKQICHCRPIEKSTNHNEWRR